MRRSGLRSARWLLLLSCLWWLASGPLTAQGLESFRFDNDLPDGFGSDERAYAAYRALEARNFARSRDIVEEMLGETPDSFEAHCLLGLIQRESEGNLPASLYHLKRSLQLFEARYPDPIIGPWFWHALSLIELAMVSGEMGRHEDKLAYLDQRDEYYLPRRPADRGWPLMRLRRYDEARAVVAEALITGRPQQVAAAKTALCAIEAELQNREASYRACLDALEYDRVRGMGSPAVYTNAGEAALGMLRLDEAERYIMEGSELRASMSVANPWMDLLLLYVAEGRMPEGLEAMRRMLRWRQRQAPAIHEQNRAESDMAAAVFLLAAGRAAKAAEITTRGLHRPDRTGFTSSESEQFQGALALIDSLARRTTAELVREEASWSGFPASLGLRLEAAQNGLAAWSSARRTASLVAAERMLVSTLRPYLAGSMELPEWIGPELVAILGPGVVDAALKKARRQESLEEAEGYFEVYAAEIALRRGRHEQALGHVERALEALPIGEVLMQARAAALGAWAARHKGRGEQAMELFDRALQLEPGVIRRLGIALPTAFSRPTNPLEKKALALLRRSPRFERADGGFLLEVEGDEKRARACLFGRDVRIACVPVQARAGEDVSGMARRLAALVHERVFAPRIDLTQSDLRSLDGSTTPAGLESSRRMQRMLDRMVGEDEE